MPTNEVLLFEALPTALQLSISAGNTRNYCPRCDGGSSREQSLDVRQADTGVLKLKCYRASCGWFAITITDPNAELQRKSVKPPQPYREPTARIGGEIRQTLQHVYGLEMILVMTHGWRMSLDGKTLVMSVRDKYGNDRGHVTRTFDTPKRCYTFKATAQPWLDHWSMETRTGIPTVVVEDCLSACRLACCGLNAVALLGTSMTADQAQEIRDAADGEKVFLALDRDAFEKSLHMCKRHGHILQMFPVCLTEDIKNMPYNKDIQDLFGV